MIGRGTLKLQKNKDSQGLRSFGSFRKKRTAKLTFLKSSGAWPEQNLQRCFEADTVDVIDLIEEDQPQETMLRVNANGMTFEFRTLSPEDSVVGILRKMNGAAG